MSQMFGCSTAGGTCAAFPDVCKTPSVSGTITIPYPNTAQVSSASDTCNVVLFSNRDSVTEASSISRSNGDEAGVIGGVSSSTFGDEVGFTTSSSKVYADGDKVIYLTSVAGHNGSSANAPAGVVCSPSQTTVWVAM